MEVTEVSISRTTSAEEVILGQLRVMTGNLGLMMEPQSDIAERVSATDDWQ